MKKNLIQEIEKRMKALELTPITAAKQAGLSRDTIRDIIRGKSLNPSHETLIKVAEALRCTVEDLTGEPGLPPHNMWRGVAVDAYAQLQAELAQLLKQITNMQAEDSKIVYYGIGNSGDRLAILDSLKRNKHPDSYNVFWKSLVAEISILDRDFAELTRWYPADALPRRSRVTGFANHCYAVEIVARLFRRTISAKLSSKSSELWTEVLNTPLVYPPPATHPLARLLSADKSSRALREPG